MNRKQLIVLWIGIAVFSYLSFIYDPEDIEIALIGQLVSIVLVTAGLIYTFKDKKKD